VLIFAFAFISGEETLGPGVTAGILWVTLLFSGTVALGRTFDRERENEAIRSLLLSPVPRSAIYIGKLAGTVFLMLLVQAVVTPLVGLLFNAAVGERAALLALSLVLGTAGFAAVGVVLSAALLRARNRDTLLASLLFPVVVPVFLAGAKSTSQLLDPAMPDLSGALFWLEFLAACDVVFVAVGIWAFEPVVTGE
jgi:heme exporter protein B